MRRSRLGQAATLAAALWLIQGLLTTWHHQPDKGWDAVDFLAELLLVAALAASVAALAALRSVEDHAYARAGALLAAAGMADLLLSALASLVSGEAQLGALWQIGVIASLLGLAAVVVGVTFGPNLPGVIALLLFVGFGVGIFVFDRGGGIPIAVGFQLLGLAAIRSVSAHMAEQ